MKRNLIALASIVLLGSTYSTSTMADLKPFYSDYGDEYHCGYKNDAGKVIVPINTYDACGHFSEGLAVVGRAEKSLYGDGSDKHLQGFIDQTGKLVIPVEHEVVDNALYTEYKEFSEGLVVVYRAGKYGYMNKQRKLVIPYTYQEANDFKGGLAVVTQGRGYGAIDQSGNTIVPMKFDNLNDYSEGLAVYGRRNHWNDASQYGFVDKKGNIRIEAKWDDAYKFSEGLAAVKSGGDYDGKWGVIDTAGNYIVKPKYDEPAISLFTDAYEIDDGYYKNGMMNMYNMTDLSQEHETSVTRYTLDLQGKVIANKFYDNWYAVAEEWLESNP